MSIIKMRGPIDVLFAFKIFSLPVPTRPGTRTFLQVPDPSRPEVKNPYPSDLVKGSSLIIIELGERKILSGAAVRAGRWRELFLPVSRLRTELSLAFLHIHQSLLGTMLLHCTCCEL